MLVGFVGGCEVQCSNAAFGGRRSGMTDYWKLGAFSKGSVTLYLCDLYSFLSLDIARCWSCGSELGGLHPVHSYTSKQIPEQPSCR